MFRIIWVSLETRPHGVSDLREGLPINLLTGTKLARVVNAVEWICIINSSQVQTKVEQVNVLIDEESILVRKFDLWVLLPCYITYFLANLDRANMICPKWKRPRSKGISNRVTLVPVGFRRRSTSRHNEQPWREPCTSKASSSTDRYQAHTS